MYNDLLYFFDDYGVIFVLGIFVGVLLCYIGENVNEIIRKRLLKRKIKVGAFEVEVDMQDIDGSIQKLDNTINDMQDNPQVFISYSYSDLSFVRRLVKDLKASDIKVWYSEEQLLPGDKISEKIVCAIKESRWVLAILPTTGNPKNWLNFELGIAIKTAKARNRPFIIPILTKNATIPPELIDMIYVDFRSNYETALTTLIMGIKRTPSNANNIKRG
jgi:hypothetical protein